MQVAVRLSVPEIRRRLWKLVWIVVPSTAFVLAWSQWRWQCQANARACHCRRRTRTSTYTTTVVLRQGNRVGLLIYGHAIEWTFPGYGKIQREKVLRALAQARTGDRAALASLADIPTRLFPARSQIILISPLQPGDAMPILHMRAHGYEVLVISPDPVAFEANVFGPRAALAVRIARIERQALLQRLYLAGVRVVNWNVETPLARMQR